MNHAARNIIVCIQGLVPLTKVDQQLFNRHICHPTKIAAWTEALANAIRNDLDDDIEPKVLGVELQFERHHGECAEDQRMACPVRYISAKRSLIFSLFYLCVYLNFITEN